MGFVQEGRADVFVVFVFGVCFGIVVCAVVIVAMIIRVVRAVIKVHFNALLLFSLLDRN